jgi:dihydroxyacetone kinase-like protein
MTVDTMTLGRCLDWLARYRDLVVANRDHLTELDSAIGDADHGANMDRGMHAVLDKMGAAPFTAADEFFKATGMTLVTSVGGASGPLYGTFFLRMGGACGHVDVIDASTLAAALRAGLEGIVARGKAERGDKTMFDAIDPALQALDESLGRGSTLGDAAAAAHAAAVAGRNATIPMLARKGRASYLGERSIGHMDPGAASATMLFEALAAALRPDGG